MASSPPSKPALPQTNSSPVSLPSHPLPTGSQARRHSTARRGRLLYHRLSPSLYNSSSCRDAFPFSRPAKDGTDESTVPVTLTCWLTRLFTCLTPLPHPYLLTAYATYRREADTTTSCSLFVSTSVRPVSSPSTIRLPSADRTLCVQSINYPSIYMHAAVPPSSHSRQSVLQDTRHMYSTMPPSSLLLLWRRSLLDSTGDRLSRTRPSVVVSRQARLRHHCMHTTRPLFLAGLAFGIQPPFFSTHRRADQLKRRPL